MKQELVNSRIFFLFTFILLKQINIETWNLGIFSPLSGGKDWLMKSLVMSVTMFSTLWRDSAGKREVTDGFKVLEDQQHVCSSCYLTIQFYLIPWNKNPSFGYYVGLANYDWISSSKKRELRKDPKVAPDLENSSVGLQEDESRRSCKHPEPRTRS